MNSFLTIPLERQPISSIPENGLFKLGRTSTVYVRMQEKDGKIGYRHKLTDFPEKAHYYAQPDMKVVPVK